MRHAGGRRRGRDHQCAPGVCKGDGRRTDVHRRPVAELPGDLLHPHALQPRPAQQGHLQPDTGDLDVHHLPGHGGPLQHLQPPLAADVKRCARHPRPAWRGGSWGRLARVPRAPQACSPVGAAGLCTLAGNMLRSLAGSCATGGGCGRAVTVASVKLGQARTGRAAPWLGGLHGSARAGVFGAEPRPANPTKHIRSSWFRQNRHGRAPPGRGRCCGCFAVPSASGPSGRLAAMRRQQVLLRAPRGFGRSCPSPFLARYGC
mmetsp:Transcript_20370/g.68364  ORF Transcript_20370/g.68364 Transcript_20370/m.68364 type:complete len:260 (-) Transcript_20370:143-922(-)